MHHPIPAFKDKGVSSLLLPRTLLLLWVRTAFPSSLCPWHGHCTLDHASARTAAPLTPHTRHAQGVHAVGWH